MESNYLKDDGITWKNVNEAKAKPKKPKPLSLETCRPQISVLGGGLGRWERTSKGDWEDVNSEAGWL